MKKKETYTKKDIKDITFLIGQNKEIERINMRKILAVGEWEDLMKRIEVLENNRTITIVDQRPPYTMQFQLCTCHLGLTNPCPIHSFKPSYPYPGC